jgi:hypothetical protein
MTPKQFVKAYKRDGSIKAVAKVNSITYHEARTAYLEAKELGLIQALRVGRKSNGEVVTPQPRVEGTLRAKKTPTAKLPKKGQVKRYLCTSAQNNTHLHEGLWENLLAFAEYADAEILVSRFAYQRSGLNRGGDKAIWTKKFDERLTDSKKETLYGSDRYVWFPEIYDGYISDNRIELAPGLVWCGEWQRNPTTVNPLSGFQVYTGRKSGIFPHVKLCMESVPTSKNERTRFNYTTGTVTMRNYIQKGAGLKAEFHHCYGALLVEVDSDGDWFCRQLSADSDGTFYDLDVRVSGGEVTHGHRPEGLTLGDIHRERIDPTCRSLTDAIQDDLNPEHIFYHDIINFGPRNHHDRKDPFKKFKRHVEDEEDVRAEIEQAMMYLGNQADHWQDSKHVVVDSNHDRALERWLREADWRHDPINMMFYMESVHAKLSAIANDDEFHMLRHWWWEFEDDRAGGDWDHVIFLDEDESYVICDDAHGGIECGMHGHLGANGGRGNIKSFAKMGRRANIGHSHSAGIVEGIWQAGTSSLMDLEYNKGLSSWSHSHILTYANGKRAMITVSGGKYRADMKAVPMRMAA